MAVQDDKELVTQCLTGSEEAWSILYKRTYNTIRFVAHWKKWNFDFEDAEEIIQEVFTGLVTSLKSFKFDCSLETFASNIAKNKCVSEIRKITAQKREGEKNCLSIDAADEDGSPRLVLEDTHSSFYDHLECTETRELLTSALDNIGTKCREIIKLKYFDNFSYDKIVSTLNIPMGTVASRLKRCLLELRNLCEQNKGDLL